MKELLTDENKCQLKDALGTFTSSNGNKATTIWTCSSSHLIEKEQTLGHYHYAVYAFS